MALGEELHELHEHAEHVEHDNSLAPVSLTMGIVAVFLAGASMMGHRSHTEEVLIQNRITNQWSHYQAKSIRRNTAEMFLDLMKVAHFSSEGQAEVQEKYIKNAERYLEQQKELEAEANKLTDELAVEKVKGDRFDLGEGFLEISLIVISLTLLTHKRAFWFTGMFLALLGIAVAGTALTQHEPPPRESVADEAR